MVFTETKAVLGSCGVLWLGNGQKVINCTQLCPCSLMPARPRTAHLWDGSIIESDQARANFQSSELAALREPNSKHCSCCLCAERAIKTNDDFCPTSIRRHQRLFSNYILIDGNSFNCNLLINLLGQRAESVRVWLTSLLIFCKRVATTSIFNVGWIPT